jgi:uncharacterized protein
MMTRLLIAGDMEKRMKPEVKKPTEEELKNLGVKQWPIWEKEESIFDWHYDEKEICYILEGDIEIKFNGNEAVNLSQGDLVTFPKGLSCVWNIKRKVRKHYNFE